MQQMQSDGANVTEAAARFLARIVPLRSVEEDAERPPQQDTWADLCKWGAVAIGVLCLTSAVAALILALAG